MNTRISYLYRDADNYKMHHEEVLRGEITPQQLMTIVCCLNEKEYFIPHQVGLPEIRFEQVTESDHPWFELCPEQDFSSTDAEPTIEMTVDELVKRFQTAKGKWDDKTFSSYAATILGTEESTGEKTVQDEKYIFVVEGSDDNTTQSASLSYAFRVSLEEAREMVKVAQQKGIPMERVHVFPLSSGICLQ